MTEQDNVQAVQDIYAAFQQGDIETVLKALTDDVRWWVAGSPNSLPYAGTYTGREQVTQFFKVLGETVEFETFEPQEYLAQGEKVVASGRDRRRTKSNNNVFENQWAMIFTLRQGKVTAFRAYDDTEAAASAIRDTRHRAAPGA
jgi:ketosteroid isomerase-like protein